MTKKIIAAILAAIMLLSASTAFAAETANTSGKQYYLDLEMVDDKTFTEPSVDLVLNINGEETILYKDGRTQKPDGTMVNEADLGSAILFDYRPNGKLDEASMPITFVPIRRIAQALSGYGVRIDWDSENAVVVLDTPANGRIQFPIGATSIEANGTTYEETTYRFPVRPGQPVGDPINIVSSRHNRTYVTVRFLSNLLIDNCNFSWKDTERLTVTGTMEKGSGVEKTYGINENFVDSYEINWPALPTFNAAVKDSPIGTNAKIVRGPSIGIPFEVDGVSLGLGFGYGYEYNVDENDDKCALRIDLNYMLDYDNQRVLIDAILRDLINDNDREQVLSKLDEINKNMTVGYTLENGSTSEAITWWNNYTKNYTLNEVEIAFSYDGKLAIRTK